MKANPEPASFVGLLAITSKQSYRDYVISWRKKYKELSARQRKLKEQVAESSRHGDLEVVKQAHINLADLAEHARTAMEERCQARIVADHLIMSARRRMQSEKTKAGSSQIS